MLKALPIFFWLLLILYTSSVKGDQLNFNYPVQFPDHSLTINVAIASNQSQRETGLMTQSAINDHHGMLFIYPKATNQAMWMKNMNFPLDVLFIDQDGLIVWQLINIPPCQHNPCKTYAAGKKFTYMLEVNSGFIKRHQIAIGERLLLPILP